MKGYACRGKHDGRRRLSLWLACWAWLACVPAAHAQHVTVAGSGTDLGTARIMADAFKARNPGTSVQVLRSIGTGGAVKGVLRRVVDVGLASRPLRANEKQPNLRATLYARTPLVFAVSRNAAASEISTAEMVRIYTGEMRLWPDGRAIRPILRPTHESDTLIVTSALPEIGEAMAVARGRHLPVATTDQETADMLERVPGAVGTSTLALIRSEKRDLKPLRLNGIAPSPDALKDDAYPLYKSLYLLTYQPSAAAQAFVNFVLSDEGRRILEETGHLPVTPSHAAR